MTARGLIVLDMIARGLIVLDMTETALTLCQMTGKSLMMMKRRRLSMMVGVTSAQGSEVVRGVPRSGEMSGRGWGSVSGTDLVTR